MKTRLLLLITLTFFINSYSQIGFEEHIIIDETFAADATTDVFAADIDGDGDDDLLSASLEGNIVWYTNNNGVFEYGQQNIITESVNGGYTVYASDLDGDGDMDVISGSVYGPKIAWYENLDGLGNFGPYQQLFPAYGVTVRGIFSADLDGDGDLDIITGSNSNKISWHENLDGLGDFGSRQIISVNTLAANVNSVLAADIDGDGDLDLIAGCGENGVNGVYWWENLDGQANFGYKQIVDLGQTTGVYEINTVDIDSDGDLDIVAAAFAVGRIVYYENLDGLGDFSSAIIIANINGARSVQSVDVDGDMDIDIIYAAEDFGQVGWIENIDGLGTFGYPQFISSNANKAFSVYSLDVDGDGDLDVASASMLDDKIAWYENLDGLGSFGTEQIITENADGASSVYASDLNGDGNIDVISGSFQDGKVAWYENNGLGDFSPQNILTVSFQELYSVISKDLDGDGDLDIISAKYGPGSTGYIIWHENLDGLGNFGNGQIINAYVDDPYSVYVEDIDGDGDFDVLSASQLDNTIVWFENIDGQGNFGSIQVITENANDAKSVFVADIDGDGDADVISASKADDKVAWYENLNGLGSFGEQQIITTNAIQAYSVHCIDIDGDGDMDVISASQGDGKVSWYENTDGLGDFSIEHVVTTNASGARSIYVGDFDGDGDSDIVSASINDNKIAWYENKNGLGDFGALQIISVSAKGANSVYVEDIDNDGDLDVLSASLWDSKIAWYENLGNVYNVINGVVSFDAQNNGCSSNNIVTPNVLIETDNGTDSYATFSQNNGLYSINMGQGSFTTIITSGLPFYYDSNPVFHTSDFNDVGNIDIADFCIESNQTVNDVNISFYPLSDARPGFEATYQIVYRNLGTTILTEALELTFDETKISYIEASQTPVIQSSNSLTFDYYDLLPFETRTVNVTFNVFTPPTTENGDVLTFTSIVNPVTGDYTEEDNTFILEQTVVGSYDPNDIQVLEGDEIYLSEVDEFLHYIIRFQNVGTASAINVRVTNELDPNLDWNTLQIENISHTNRVEIRDGNQVEFIFDNINLPDSTSNEEGSHGYIQYKIKPKNTVGLGDSMSNNADIYFDFNPSVLTNIVTTTVVENLSVNDHSILKTTIYPNPSNGLLQIKSNNAITKLIIYNQLGQIVLEESNKNGIQSINLDSLSQGIYSIKLSDTNFNNVIKRLIKK